jgi:hypothetical protein
VGTPAALDEALGAAWARGGATLVEAQCFPHKGARIMMQIWAELAAAPEGLPRKREEGS